MKEQHLHIFGPHRSGTNFLERIIDMNYYTRILNPNQNFNEVWKHSCIGGHKVNDNNPIIVIYKSIYMWLESVLIRRPDLGYHFMQALHNLDKDKYNQVMGRKCKYYFINGNISLSAVVEAYVNFYEQFLKCGKEVTFIKYEDLLYEDSLERILTTLNKTLPRKPVKVKIPSSVSQSPFYTDESTHYYREGKPDFLNSECLKIVDDIVGSRLEELYNKKI
jgi:hypothetical protein